MYTANLVDTVIFRSLGKYPNPQWHSLENAVTQADTELWVPATVYRELTNFGATPPTNPYLDLPIEQGWIRVATPLPGTRGQSFTDVDGVVEQARHLTDDYLSDQTKYPVTNNWNDAALVALAVQLFEQNARIRVITHTADQALAKACARIPPEFGYYETIARYYNPPQMAKQEFPTVESLTWDGR